MPTGTTSARAAGKRLQQINERESGNIASEQAAIARIQNANATQTDPNKVIPLYSTVPGAYNKNGTPLQSLNMGAITGSRVNNIANLANEQLGYRAPGTQTQNKLPSVKSSSGGGGGGGGGGGAAAPVLSQQQLDWMTSLMNGARPGALTANNLDLPDYQGMAVRAFDPSFFNQARNAWTQGVQQDLGTADRATQDMLDFLGRNYTNAYNNPLQGFATMSQAPGMDQAAMRKLLQGQGVNPNLASGAQNEALQADQALRNVWAMLGVNEDRAQTNRLANAQQYGTQAREGITAAGRAGQLGIDLGQGQAQSAWQQRADERAYQDYQMQQQLLQQEAMQNWQRANTVQDTNATNTNSYNNAVLQAMLGLLPQLQTNPNLALPQGWQVGLGPLPGGGTDPSDPYNWKGIAAGIANGSIAA